MITKKLLFKTFEKNQKKIKVENNLKWTISRTDNDQSDNSLDITFFCSVMQLNNIKKSTVENPNDTSKFRNLSNICKKLLMTKNLQNGKYSFHTNCRLSYFLRLSRTTMLIHLKTLITMKSVGCKIQTEKKYVKIFLVKKKHDMMRKINKLLTNTFSFGVWCGNPEIWSK